MQGILVLFNAHKRINADTDFAGYLFDGQVLFYPSLFDCAAKSGIINFIKSIERIVLVVIHFEFHTKQGCVLNCTVLYPVQNIRVRQ